MNLSLTNTVRHSSDFISLISQHAEKKTKKILKNTAAALGLSHECFTNRPVH